MRFRTKARAVDLLGKGQIADLPTAITELWKNGYDAYADNLKAELYKQGYNGLEHSYFIISDDGKGMSNSDILDKWLVLGTDSKSRAVLEEESEETLWKLPRIKSGEKGIGRLSVAYLGNPMLMITRKLGEAYELLLFDWRLLENYNLFLDDVSIPTKSIHCLDELSVSLEDLKKGFLINFEGESFDDKFIIDRSGELYEATRMEIDNCYSVWKDNSKQIELKKAIISSILNIKTENCIIESIKKHFETSKLNTGTFFLIFNPIDQILELSEKDEDDLEDRDFFISSLRGFTNPFKEINIKIGAEFLIHKEVETLDLLTSRGNFFKRSDFALADVYINGLFDGNGSFMGKARFYNEVIDYSYTNPRKKDSRSFYGCIPMELGYSLGEEKSSWLTENSFAEISNKVKEYGGLYIYRDDFRVLPYGRQNYDFLGFEERRSKRAGTYFFSYRRIYGYLDLTRDRNPDLKDKSSREGLINNAPYRAFVNDAVGFFITFAQDFFATSAKDSIFQDKKKKLNDEFNALKADKKREKAEKIAFSKSLNSYPKRLEEHQIKYENLLARLSQKLENINVVYSEVESLLDELQKLDIEYRDLIPRIPKRYKPTDTQKERLYKYENQLNNYVERVSTRRDELNRKAQEKLEIRDLKINFVKKYNAYISSLTGIINQHKVNLTDKVKSLLEDYNERSRKIITELKENKDKLAETIVSKQQIGDLSQIVEDKYNSLLEEVERTLLPLVEHINRLSFDIDEEQIQGAYKAQYDQMKYQWEQTRDTAQLGIAVEIIDHEFNQLYSRINNQLSVLNLDESINSLKDFQFLERNFKQLEDKYALLSPLYRVSGAIAKDIKGNSIYEYLKEFFDSKIQEYAITITASNSFQEFVINIKEPVIYTVFINIINNAIYWMRNKDKRVINLDFLESSKEIIIVNSGEKIPDFKLDKLFDLFYSQRPNGRGIGLYLTKQSLTEAGFQIEATNDKIYNSLNGACFLIKKIDKL